MSNYLEIIWKFFVESLRVFNTFLYSLYGLITRSRQVDGSRPPIDDPNHDPMHVHFRKSVVEKPTAVPAQPKHERRPTSGKGLLSTPLKDLLDDSDDDSDDGVLSVHSLAFASEFEAMPKADKEGAKKGIKFDDVLNAGGSQKEANLAETAFGGVKKRTSILNDETLPTTVQVKLDKFIKQLPKVSPIEFDQTFNEIVIEFPRFQKIKSKQVYEIIERDITIYKNLPMEAAAEKLMEALCSCPKQC